jgi:peptidoglycan/LPS O-acetylase OafA/YrhL
MDALMIGGVIALIIREKDGPPAWMRSPLFVSGCVVLFTIDALFNESLFSGLPSIIRAASHFSITSVAFGALVLAAVTTRRDQLWVRLFKAPVMRFFGKYSYAIYVVHLAVIVALPKFVEVTLGRVPGFPATPGLIVNGMIALLISVGIALMTWRLIERPALLLKERFPFDSTVLQSRAVADDTFDPASRTPLPQTE